jgi:peroxiredoxin
VELQGRLAELEATGAKLFAISYDPVPVLGAFAQEHGITFPLLSDEGSKVIQELGLLNQHVAEQQAYYGRGVEARHEGIPYPGTFLLDENGVVVNRQFEQSYRVRPAPDVLLEELVPVETIGSVVSAQAEREGMRVVAWLATPTYRPYERIHVHIDLRMSEGVHIYAPPAPAGLTGLAVDVDPIPHLEVEPLEAPAGEPFEMEGMPPARVFAGHVGLTLPLHVDAAEGDQTLHLVMHYQACTESLCYPPDWVSLDLPIKGLDMVRP